MNPVFITGGTGYIGRALISALIQNGYAIHALVRPGSQGKLARAVIPVIGNALDEATFAGAIPAAATVVHLVGTPHPNPAKAAEFQRVDLVSIRAAVAAASQSAAQHIVYLSVAHPAPIMQAYIAVRREGEAIVRGSGIPATILRPWYVLGPGHWWPGVLLPVYALLRRLPATREGAERLGLVTHRQMVAALVGAVAAPPAAGVRIVEVPEIRRSARA
ncbi:MAG: NAD(P)H-binding protein [Luteitalea sp.]|nr:NAD(P)H-binding protein [Luteitalea sp.]